MQTLREAGRFPEILIENGPYPMSTRPVLLLQAGDAPAFIRERCGNFPDMFLKVTGLDEYDTRVIRVFAGETAGDPVGYRAVVVTGSEAMVTDREAWSEAAGEWLRRAVGEGVPTFGVCYGHQLMAQALGGVADYHPDGSELGTFQVALNQGGREDGFFGGALPERFMGNLSHSQTVAVLPQGAAGLAASAHDPHQIVRYSATAVSTQFHPEFDAKIMRVYLESAMYRRPENRELYADLVRRVEETPESQSLIRRFIEQYG